jgi:hypothetical protein
MMFSFQLQVFLIRFFGCVKTADANTLAVDHDLNSPFTLMCADTQKTRLVGKRWFAHVLQISKTVNLSKIFKRVVLLVSVFVINVPGWKRASYIQPSQSMRKSFLVIDRNSPVPGVCWTSCTFADKIGSAMMNLPKKLTSFRVVVKNGSDMVSGNHESEFTIGATK